MPSGNFHFDLCAKLNAEATSGTGKLHCYVVKFRFTSLYGNQELDRSRFVPKWFPDTRLHCCSTGILPVKIMEQPETVRPVAL